MKSKPFDLILHLFCVNQRHLSQLYPLLMLFIDNEKKMSIIHTKASPDAKEEKIEKVKNHEKLFLFPTL